MRAPLLHDGQMALEGGGLKRDPFDPRGLPRPCGSEPGRFAATPAELRWLDRLLVLHPLPGKPEFVWSPTVAGVKRRRRSKGGFYVETTMRITLQFAADALIVIDRPGRDAVAAEVRRIEARSAAIRDSLRARNAPR
jgi:hypothetical protein